MLSFNDWMRGDKILKPSKMLNALASPLSISYTVSNTI